MKILACAALLLTCALPAAHAAKGHVHGEGQLEVVVDKDRLVIALELPLDAAVGFERAPKDAREKAALDEALKRLDDASLFVPSAAAHCTLQTKTVSVPFSDGKASDGHADIDANHEFRCANPAALTGFETSLFSHFKRLYRIEAQRVGPNGQGAARLTPKQPRMGW